MEIVYKVMVSCEGRIRSIERALTLAFVCLSTEIHRPDLARQLLLKMMMLLLGDDNDIFAAFAEVFHAAFGACQAQICFFSEKLVSNVTLRMESALQILSWNFSKPSQQ